MGFKATQNKGFQMTFENGFTISVQWGKGNYCSRKNYDSDIFSEMKENMVHSEDAEIAIWDADGNWFDFDIDQVKGWCTADEVGGWITCIVQSSNFEDLRQFAMEKHLMK